MGDDHEQRQRFEKMGEEQVRLLLSTNKFNHVVELIAIGWLAEKDQEAGKRAIASSEKQFEIANSAKDAAWAAARAAEAAASDVARQAVAAERQARAAEKANTRATIALIVSIVSIVTTIVIFIVGLQAVPKH